MADKILIGLLLAFLLIQIIINKSICNSSSRATSSVFKLLIKIFFEDKLWLLLFLILVLLTAYLTYMFSGKLIDFILLPYLMNLIDRFNKRKGFIRKLTDVIMFEPNFYGVGINVKKIFIP